MSLCVDKLTEILASDFLNVVKEELVFEAAMLWLNKCPSRKQSFEKVRFFTLLVIKCCSLFFVRNCVVVRDWLLLVISDFFYERFPQGAGAHPTASHQPVLPPRRD